MKKILFLMLAGAGQAAFAGGAMTGGASEWTQVMNNVQLINQYAQQVKQYSTQMQQYQYQLQNMQLNPASVMNTNIPQLINGIGAVMQAGQSIGGTMSTIDANFSQKFNNPMAGTYSQNFKTWTVTSQDTLGAAMRAAGLHRDSFASDTAALQALYNKTQSSQGTVAAVQTLSEVSVSQTQQLQKLQDLVATQNLASSTYMAGQNAKAQALQEAQTIKFKATTLPSLNSYKNPIF
jgi:P-type conjugative transfer protein TrbJ